MAIAKPSCPKCETPRRAGAVACVKCGLAVERMEAFAKNQEAAVPEALVAAWDRTVLAWDDQAGHDEVLRLVAQHDAYAWAAMQYRTRAGDPTGDRQLARLRKAAEITLLASATQRADTTPKPYRALTAVLVMFIFAAVAGLLYAMVVHDTADTPKGITPVEPVKPLQPIPRPTK